MKISSVDIIEGDAYRHAELFQSLQDVLRDGNKLPVFALLLYLQGLKLVMKPIDFSLEVTGCSIHGRYDVVGLLFCGKFQGVKLVHSERVYIH